MNEYIERVRVLEEQVKRLEARVSELYAQVYPLTT